MKILIINKYWYARGGADAYALWLAEALQQRGHTVCVFSVDHPKNVTPSVSYECISGVDTETMRWQDAPRIIGRMLWSFEAQTKLRAFLAQEKPDIAHVHNLYTQMSPSVLPVLKEAGIPVVATVHDYGMTSANYSLYDEQGIDYLGTWWSVIKRKGLKHSRLASIVGATVFQLHAWMHVYERNITRMVFTSDFVKRLFTARRWQGDKGVVLPLPFDVQDGFMRKGAGEYFFFAGRLHKTKGVHVLIDAARRTGLPIKIAGSGPGERVLHEQAGAMTNVDFLGHLSHKKTLEYMRDARAVVVPSVWLEPFGLVALEPQALGVPVIASNIGGLKEVVVHGQTGLLVEPDDVEQLAMAMQRLWDDPEEAQRLGAMGKRRVQTQYAAKEHLEKLEHLYNTLVDGILILR